MIVDLEIETVCWVVLCLWRARVWRCMLGCGSLCCNMPIDVVFPAIATHYFPPLAFHITAPVCFKGLNDTDIYMYVHVQ